MGDISNIKASTNTVNIVHPATNEPIGLSIVLRSLESPQVKEVQRRITNELLRNRKITAEKSEANRLDILAAATERWTWEGDLSFNGEKPECNPNNARRVYKELPWVKEQVDNALSDEAAFFRGTE